MKVFVSYNVIDKSFTVETSYISFCFHRYVIAQQLSGPTTNYNISSNILYVRSITLTSNVWIFLLVALDMETEATHTIGTYVF